MWRWYQNEDIGEYYWQTELGTCKNNKFTPSGARLLIRVGSLRLNENHAIKGTLQELINTAEKTAFLGDRFRSYIRAGIYQKKSSDPVQLLAVLDNSIMPGTYVRPHRHPHTFELLLPLRGRFVVLNFDDRGTVTHRAILGETCTVLEMAAGTWHAVLSLDTGGIIFEVKHGGYQPVAADDYAHWAPAEGEPGTTELMAWYAQAQVGDSTFAV